MEGGEKSRWRMYGMMSTSFLSIALILWAIVCLDRASAQAASAASLTYGIALTLVAEGRHRPVPRNEGGFLTHRPQPASDRGDELLLVAVREIPPADRTAK